MDIYDVEVLFDKYCNKCKYKNTTETKDPCNECLDSPANCQSEKPVKFEFAQISSPIMNTN